MRRILLYIAIILAAVGCQRQSEPITPIDPLAETGQLKFDGFSVTTSTEELLAPRPTSATRAEGDGDLNGLMPHILTVTITDNETGQVVERYANHAIMPSTVVLKAGSYTVTAATADVNSQLPFNGKVGFNQPQYGATKQIEITSGQITSVALACTQITAGVTVSYSDLFKDVYPCTLPGETYRVRIFSSYGGDIVFLKEETATAHFVVPTADMTFFYQVIIDRVSKEGFIETLTGQETPFDAGSMPVRKACNYNLTIKVINQ